MATEGSPNGGLDEHAERVYVNGADLTLVAYTNAADSLNETTVAANLVQPTSANGYAPIVLSGTWVTLDGVVTYTHPGSTHPDGHPGWTATAAWSGTVRGVAVIFGTRVMHFKDLTVPFVASNLRKLFVDLATLVAP